MNYAKYVVAILSVFWFSQALAQEADTTVLLTGVVVTGDHLNPVPNANILILNKSTGTMAGENGSFRFQAHRNDTIQFSAVGFKKGFFIVPDSLNRDHYSLVQIMTNDTIYLQETMIFPYKSYDEFKDELLTLTPPPTDDDRAKSNLSQAQMYERYQAIYMDGEANYNYSVDMQSEKAYYGDQIPPYQIFNVFAWVEFVESWKRGDYKKK